MLARVPDDDLLDSLLGRSEVDATLSTVLELDETELKARGFSEVEASRILVAAEIARRHQPRGDAPSVTDPRQVVSLLFDLRTATTARLVLILLDRRLRVQDKLCVAEVLWGCATSVDVSLRDLAARRSASAVIVAHNHLTGGVAPSKSDIKFTEDVGLACRRAGVELVDHIVVTRRDWLSFRAEGLMA